MSRRQTLSERLTDDHLRAIGDTQTWAIQLTLGGKPASWLLELRVHRDEYGDWWAAPPAVVWYVAGSEYIESDGFDLYLPDGSYLASGRVPRTRILGNGHKKNRSKMATFALEWGGIPVYAGSGRPWPKGSGRVEFERSIHAEGS